nr:flagellar hook-length control protein FliK [uncultured Helicobacter sp.]
MLPFLEVESINQKSAIRTKTKDLQSPTESENSQDFTQIFSALTQPTTKKDSTKNDPTPKAPITKNDKLTPNKQPSNFLKILDEKYNLTKDFKEQKTTNLRSAKDLLELSKIQKQDKTLKDLSEVAKNLQLHLKKISAHSEESLENMESKNILDSKLQSHQKINPKNNPKKPIFNAILQDKNFTPKDSLKEQDTKTTKNIKKDSTFLELQKPESKTKELKETPTLVNDKNDKKPEPKTKELKETPTLVNDKNDKKPEPKTKELKETPTLVNDKNDKKPEPKTKELKETPTLVNDKNDKQIESKTHTTQIKENLNSKLEEPKLEETKPKETKTNNTKINLESKINSHSKNTPSTSQMEFIPKNNKESQVKNDKPKEVRQNSLNPFSAVQKEEIIQQSLEQISKQENFLDNLLKTSQKPQNEAKEQIQQPIKEKEVRKESEKTHQENYQNSVQAQRESRFNPQTTFAHFSDRLRDAIATYRPPVTKISLELNPQNLGSVELTIAKNGDKLSVQISSNQSALQLIMQNTQEFKNALGNLGFQNVEIDFKDNQGNSLTNGNFNDSNQQNSQNGFQQGQQQNSQNFEQNTQQNQKETENWNENSLYIDKKAKNPYEKLAIVEFSFSYYA